MALSSILGLQPIPRDPKKTIAWRPCWMTKQNVLSSNMAATPLSFGSPGIGCKPRIVSRLNYNFLIYNFCGGRKTRVPGEKRLEQGREPTTNSTQITNYGINTTTLVGGKYSHHFTIPANPHKSGECMSPLILSVSENALFFI